MIRTVEFISASNKTKSDFMNLFLKEINITKIVVSEKEIDYVIRNGNNSYITTYNVRINKNKIMEENKKIIFFNKLIEDKNNFKIQDYDDRKDDFSDDDNEDNEDEEDNENDDYDNEDEERNFMDLCLTLK